MAQIALERHPMVRAWLEFGYSFAALSVKLRGVPKYLLGCVLGVLEAVLPPKTTRSAQVSASITSGGEGLLTLAAADACVLWSFVFGWSQAETVHA